MSVFGRRDPGTWGIPVSSGQTAPKGRRRARRSRRSRVFRALLLVVGIACIVAGGLIVGIPLYNVWHRGQTDAKALQQWKSGGKNSLTGAVAGGDSTHGFCSASSAPASDYALVTFPTLAQYGYAGVAADGTWDRLLDRSMVHYTGTAGPGEKGNDIIAFHREPDYQYIDKLSVGDTVNIEDRSCHTYTYRITDRWVLAPDAVTQLVPTNGYELTMVTCTPWWVDNDRIVWRGELVSAPASNSQPASSAGAPAAPVK